MQQTEKYGFNLIETSDAFSPEPLNENARKMAEALAEKGTCTAYLGSFEGDGTNDRTIELGISPKLIILLGNTNGDNGICMIVREWAVYAGGSGSSSSSRVTMTETGFHINDYRMCNAKGKMTYYIAFT